MKKIVSLLSVFVLLLGMTSVISAQAPISWVVEPIYDALYTPGTTSAPYFAFEKDGKGGYIDVSGNIVYLTEACSDMSASAFHNYADGNNYAILYQGGKTVLLTDDFTPIVDTESILSSVTMRFQPEINELVRKEIEKIADGTHTATYIFRDGSLFSAEVLSSGDFHSGVATAIRSDGAYGFYDKSGNFTQTDCRLDTTGFYYENLCIAEKNGKYGLVALTIYPEISVKVDGGKVYFDQLPQIVNDRTLVPLRAIFEALGAEVNWNAQTRTVTATKGETQISLTIDSDQLYVNGTAKTIDVAAAIINDRTMVPVRAISEALSCNVEWKPDTRTVEITR